jgi:hypothetical protein
LPVSADPQSLEKIDMVARAIVGDAATEGALQAAMLVAEAQIDLMRIRATRAANTRPFWILRRRKALGVRPLRAPSLEPAQIRKAVVGRH